VQSSLTSAWTTSALFSSETAATETTVTATPKAKTDTPKEGSDKGNIKIKRAKHARKPLSERRNKAKNNKKNGNSKSRRAPEVPPQPLTELKLGSKISGTVAAFTDFGVFIKINYDLKGKGGKGGYALLHKSQIRDEPVEDAKKLFRTGNIVKDLRVVTINYVKGEVGLSLRKQREKRKNLSSYKVGQEYEGKVERVVEYGAFVDIGAKNNALLHISRMSQKKIVNIRSWLNEGDKVKIRIIAKDQKKQTMAASMLDTEADEYMDRRSDQLKKMKNRNRRSKGTKGKKGESTKDGDGTEAPLDIELKSEIEYFEDAVRELEDALEG